MGQQDGQFLIQMMNVAATRAKEEFYVIGDKKLYASLGSEVANKTISIIEDYNS